MDYSELCHEPLCPYIFTLKGVLERVINLVWSPFFLLPFQSSVRARTFPADLGLQVKSLHVFQQINDWVDYGVGQVISLCLVWTAVGFSHQMRNGDSSPMIHVSPTTIRPALMPALDVDGWGVQLFPTYATTRHC